MKGDLEFSNLFFPAWQDFQERKNRIKTVCFKVCSKCGEIKPIFKFSVDKRNLDGRIGVCKKCRSREYLRYYYQNRDRILIQSKEHQKTSKRDRSIYFKNYREKHKEQLKKKAGKWYLENKEAIKERNLEFYQEHKEACKARGELWRIKNKERIRKYNRGYKLKHRVA